MSLSRADRPEFLSHAELRVRQLRVARDRGERCVPTLEAAARCQQDADRGELLDITAGREQFAVAHRTHSPNRSWIISLCGAELTA
jgi:hypothetical protein